MIRTFFTLVTVVISTIMVSLSTFIFGIFGPYSKPIYYAAKMWVNSILFAAGTKLEVEGLEKIDKRMSYVFIGNHQSHFDVFAIFSVLPLVVRFMTKKELFKIPLFGWALYISGTLRVDRTNREQSIKAMTNALERIRKGVSVVVFPEGTRSEDGVIRPFKKGGFVLAIKGDIPIVPISISGSRFILEKHSMRVNPGKIKIVFSDPVPTLEYAYQDRDELSNIVRKKIIENYDEHYNKR